MIESYPLSWPDSWPRNKKPVRSRFGTWNKKPSIYESTYKLKEELRLMGAKDLIISSNLRLKKDGDPYSNQREPEDCGIAIYFKIKDEAMVIACDTFDKCGCNIWGIAKSVEAMRGIERWGCSEILRKAFTGFKALPEKSVVSDTAWYNVLDVPANADFKTAKLAFMSKARNYKGEPPLHLVEAYNQAKQATGQNG